MGMNLYITFGNRFRHDVHPALGPVVHPDGWLRVTNLPADEGVARQYIFRMLGQAWGFDYAEQPEPGLFPRGELGVLDFETDRLTLVALSSRQIYPLQDLLAERDQT